MNERRKLWLGISAALFGTSTLTVAETPPEPGASVSDAAVYQASTADMNEGEGEGGSAQAVAGEGEGEGEGEGARSVDIATDDAAYLTRLGLIRGHLKAGYTLYGQGHADMAATHMKHPRDELYAGLVPAIEQRGGAPFDGALSALATAVEENRSQDEVDAAYEALVDAIRAAEAVAEPTLSEALYGVVGLLRTAGEEYAIGVDNGQLVNAHEYQDAWGFTQIARARLDELSADLREQAPDTVARARSVVESLMDLWPELAPGDTVDGDASRLHGAAARVELAALSLD
jgi:hypothetical protein